MISRKCSCDRLGPDRCKKQPVPQDANVNTNKNDCLFLTRSCGLTPYKHPNNEEATTALTLGTYHRTTGLFLNYHKEKVLASVCLHGTVSWLVLRLHVKAIKGLL